MDSMHIGTQARSPVISSSGCDSPEDRQVALSASSRLSAAAADEEEEAESLKRERVLLFLHVRAVCLVV